MSFTARTIVADFKTSLAAKISIGAETGSIQNNLDDDGVVLPTGSYCFTLDADNAQKEHIVCTLTGKNLTDIQSVSRQGVLSTGVVREHRIGASVSITDFSHIKNINDFASTYNGKWESPVANYAALLLLTGMSDTETRITIDDGSVYVYNLATLTWKKQTPGITQVYLTNLLGTESTGDDNRTFTMSSGSFTDKKYLQVWLNGVLQKEGASFDYVAGASNTAVFNSAVDDTDQITLRVQQ